MKKTFNIISIFILLISMFSGFFFVSEANSFLVQAACDNTSAADNDDGVCTHYSNPLQQLYNYIQISNKGKITIKYNYGFSDMIVFASECNNYETYEDEDGAIEYTLNEGKRVCATGAAYDKNKTIIHVSGDYFKQVKINNKITTSDTKTISLFDYFEYDALVRVVVVTSFFTQAVNTDQKADIQTFLNNEEICKSYNQSNENKRLLCEENTEWRTKVATYCLKCGTDKTLEDRIKSKATGDAAMFSGDANKAQYVDSKGVVLKYLSTDARTAGVIVSVANTEAEDAAKNVEELIYDTIIPAILVILAIAAGVTLAALGYQVVKSSDEAQERSDSIARIRSILIGIVVAFIILFAAEPAIKFIQGFIE